MKSYISACTVCLRPGFTTPTVPLRRALSTKKTWVKKPSPTKSPIAKNSTTKKTWVKKPSPRKNMIAKNPTTKSETTIFTQPQQPKPPNPNKVSLEDLRPSHINYYWDTEAPDDEKLKYADKLFASSPHSPIKIWTASKFRTTPIASQEPEVAFLGRSNVGKSSLLNMLMNKKICWTSSKPGRTRTMNAFGIGGTKGGESKIVLLDMPGYGKGSRSDWGTEIIKYLQGRKQLRRVFLLIDCVHGLKDTDKAILELLRNSAIPHQVIMSKIDKVLIKKKSKASLGASATNLDRLQAILKEYRHMVQPTGPTEGPGALGELLTCSPSTTMGPRQALGINAIRWAIASAAGFDGKMEVKREPTPPSSDTTTSTAKP